MFATIIEIQVSLQFSNKYFILFFNSTHKKYVKKNNNNQSPSQSVI